jgi:hypothetical protein
LSAFSSSLPPSLPAFLPPSLPSSLLQEANVNVIKETMETALAGLQVLVSEEEGPSHSDR